MLNEPISSEVSKVQLHKATQIKFLVSPHVEFAVTRRAVEFDM